MRNLSNINCVFNDKESLNLKGSENCVYDGNLMNPLLSKCLARLCSGFANCAVKPTKKDCAIGNNAGGTRNVMVGLREEKQNVENYAKLNVHSSGGIGSAPDCIDKVCSDLTCDSMIRIKLKQLANFLARVIRFDFFRTTCRMFEASVVEYTEITTAIESNELDNLNVGGLLNVNSMRMARAENGIRAYCINESLYCISSISYNVPSGNASLCKTAEGECESEYIYNSRAPNEIIIMGGAD